MAEVINIKNRRARRAVQRAIESGKVEVVENPNYQEPKADSAHWGFTLTSVDGHNEGCDLFAASAGKVTVTMRQAAVMAIMAMADRFAIPVVFEGGVESVLDPKN
jgi:hypothetical protein